MHNLKPLTPLGADTPREDRIGTLVIREVTDQAMASVAARNGQAGALQAAVTKGLSLTFPEVGKAITAGDFSALWIGPEQWMMVADHDAHEGIADELKALVGDTASVVEQTDGWCHFDVKGIALCELFERLTKAPVRQMAPGEVTRSTVEHLGVFLWRLDDQRMAVIGPRSSAASLHHALTTVAHSIS